MNKKDAVIHPEDTDGTFDRLTPQLDFISEKEKVRQLCKTNWDLEIRQATVKITDDDDASEPVQTPATETETVTTDTHTNSEECTKPIHIDTPLACYVCKKEVTTIHHFYDQVPKKPSHGANAFRCVWLVVSSIWRREIKQQT